VLIDLGVAGPRDEAMPTRRLVGSPPYCSPEQILGRPLDGRSDVYALGCTLYELVFGRPSVDAGDIDGAIDGHLHGTPAIDLPPLVSMGEPFACWLRRCLSCTRSNRPDAATARGELRRLLPAPAALGGEWPAAAPFPVLRDTVEWRVPG
jgi:eukaryotic-like serine/threonine-protein kinase